MDADPDVQRALQRGLARAIAKSWRDAEFAELLTADPPGALAQIGVEVPPGVRINVVPEDVLVVPLPAGEDHAFSDEAADSAARSALAAWQSHSRQSSITQPTT